MPIGPKGQKRPADTIENARLVARIATGEAEETYVNAEKSEGGHKGGLARARGMSAGRRREIARKAAAARWKQTEPA